MKRKVNRFIKFLQERSLTIAFAESMTCGLLSENLASYKGTADVLAGSVICYTPEVKKKLMKVPAGLVDEFTPESREVTERLARNLAGIIRADLHAAITGLAAPGGSESRTKPVGTVFFCVVYGKKVSHHKKRFYGTPDEIRQKACLEMYEFILSGLQ
jgi:nicotinamide-nucleotide amidase